MKSPSAGPWVSLNAPAGPDSAQLVIRLASPSGAPHDATGSGPSVRAWHARLAARLEAYVPGWLTARRPSPAPTLPGLNGPAMTRIVVANLNDACLFSSDTLADGCVIHLQPGTYHVTAQSGDAERRYTLTLDGQQAAVLDLRPLTARLSA